VVNCSDVEFDENQTAHISCIDNENDAHGLPEQEPIYTEEQVAPGNTGQVAHTPGQSGQVAPGNTGQVAHTPGQSGQVVPGNTAQCTNQERRITRSHRLTEHTALAAHTESAANPSDSDLRSYREVLNSPLYKHWKSAMQEEYASLMENKAFTLVKHTESKPIGCKWVYKT